MNFVPKMNRRSFFIGTAAVGGGMALGLDFGAGPKVVRAADGSPELGVWVVVRPDDTVAIRCVRTEMGQGTMTGLAQNGVLHKVQKAWVEHDVPQCGYCQSGMIMAVADLLKNKPKPTDADIDNAITNICRCGTFQQVRAAIHAAANA